MIHIRVPLDLEAHKGAVALDFLRLARGSTMKSGGHAMNVTRLDT